ncbi:MAG: hypothetical protein PWQ97_1323 [Tepidanaerobacteraceae bacterium]|nr:hypothetical protein [Tepidanaerobacteraceae bacterium]
MESSREPPSVGVRYRKSRRMGPGEDAAKLVSSRIRKSPVSKGQDIAYFAVSRKRVLHLGGIIALYPKG